jgi:hypothetical protein
MISYPYKRHILFIRFLVRTSVCVAAALAAPLSFAAAPLPPPVQAKLLDRAEVLCDNCFFGPSFYYYCFEADSKILVGYQRVPVINWSDQSKNYLTKAHPAWTVWAPPGETLPISYDAKHIWVARPDPVPGATEGGPLHVLFKAGKQVKLLQNYSRDVFTNNERCRDAVRAKGN